jgi:calcineurin-like phosphoesterase family protein
VYHLGDVALGRIAESLPLVGRLNGRKLIVPGNHDRVSSAYPDQRPDFQQRFRDAYAEVFDEILPETTQVIIDGRRVLLSHYPYAGDSQELDRHVDQRPVDDGLRLLHGHIHDTGRAGWIKDNMFHVGVDVHDFYPVPQSQIITWLRELDQARTGS